MALDHWAKHPDGSVAVGPLLSSEVIVSEGKGAIRLIVAYDNKELKTGGRPVQATLTAAQARELGKALLALADRLGAQKKPTLQ